MLVTQTDLHTPSETEIFESDRFYTNCDILFWSLKYKLVLEDFCLKNKNKSLKAGGGGSGFVEDISH
jgi:hypothetical protein